MTTPRRLRAIAAPSDVQVTEARFAGRPVWLLNDGTRARHETAWRALDADYDGTGPCGLLTLLDVPDAEAEWAEPRSLYAGFSKDGRQGRIAYFSTAVAPARADWSARAAPFEILPFATQSAVTPDDVVSLWTREEVLKPEEARRRVDEVLLVAVDADGRPMGVCTSYLDHNTQLDLDLWYARIFVASAHRASNVATALAVGAVDQHGTAFAEGRDTRGAGLAMVVQNEMLKRTQVAPVWTRSGLTLIAETPEGHHVRATYFAGATVPLRA